MTLAYESGRLADTDDDLLAKIFGQAVDDYCWTAPDGEQVWAPYVINGWPCQPDPDNTILDRPGAGKASPADFRTAAEYAYDWVDSSELDDGTTMGDAVRRRLVDGSLPDDNYNYTGIDCSGFVTQALAAGLQQLGVSFYDWLRIPHDDMMVHLSRSIGTTDRALLKRTVQASKDSHGLPVNTFTDLLRPGNSPARSVNVDRLISNLNCTAVDVDEVRPGDIAWFRPKHGSTSHVALALESDDSRYVKFAHSTRSDPRLEVGGVNHLELSRKFMRHKDHHFARLGFISMHRLKILDPAESKLLAV